MNPRHFDPRHNGDAPPHVYVPPTPAQRRERAIAAAQPVLRAAGAVAQRAVLAGVADPELRAALVIVARQAEGGPRRETFVGVPGSTALRAASRGARRALAAAEGVELDAELIAALREVACAG